MNQLKKIKGGTDKICPSLNHRGVRKTAITRGHKLAVESHHGCLAWGLSSLGGGRSTQTKSLNRRLTDRGGRDRGSHVSPCGENLEFSKIPETWKV